MLCLLSFLQTQAQNRYYVYNNNGTYQSLTTDATHQMEFDAAQKLVAIKLTDGTTSQFATAKVDSIALTQPTSGKELTYTDKFSVSFDSNDKNNYNEITETIITDELIDESGDFVENYSTSKVITITFSETGVKYTNLPDNITCTVSNNTHLVINSTISKAGYIVKGSCSNGSLKIYSTKKFQIKTDGLNLTNPTGPAINIQSGKTVYFTLGARETTLCDGEKYAAPALNADGTEEDQKGTIFSEGQLIFNGTGTLNVTSKGGHAICSDDYIRVRSGNINILSAAKDGFHTNDLFRVGRTASASPTITINAGSDGVDCGKGYVLIEAGKIDITSGGEAFNVSSDEKPEEAKFTINGGFIKATTTGEKAAVVKTSNNFTQGGGIIQGTVKGGGSKIINCDGNIHITAGKLTATAQGSLSSDTTTAGGFKSEGNTTIDGGEIAIECTGEGSKGFNCNGTLTINGGEIALLATAQNFEREGYDRKTRAITTVGLDINGGKVYTKAYDHAINAESFNLNNGEVQAISTSTTGTAGTLTQKGGWLLTKNAE